MATPQESITTVNGRRCTRSRARTAATTSTTAADTAVVTPTEVTTSTTAEEASQIQSSTAAAVSSPPPDSSTTSTDQPAEQPTEQPTEQPVAAPITPTTEAAATSAIGTISSIPTSSTRIAPLPKLAPGGPTAAAPGRPSELLPPEPTEPSAVPSQAATVSSVVPMSLVSTSSEVVALAVPTSSAAVALAVPTSSVTAPADVSTSPEKVPVAVPTSSDVSPTADPTSSITTSTIPPQLTAPAASDTLNSPDTSPDQPIQTDTNPQPSIPGTTAVEQPQPTSSTLRAVPSDGSAGIIAPNHGPDGSSDDSPLTLGNGSGGNIGGIIGGVFGGVAALALICGLLFFCLRKRKSKPARWNEKKAVGPRFVEKIKSIPAGVGALVAKVKGNQAVATRNQYQQHTAQSSVGSVYSTDTSGRVRSASEPQGMVGVRRPGSASSKKSERNLLRKKPSSVSSNYRFPGIIEDTASPTMGNADPFADPEPPKSLMLLNPDPRSAPVTPQVPAATVGREIQDPFASILDPPRNVPAFAGVPVGSHQHRRTMSSMSALSSHPPSSFPTKDPFRNPPNAPPAPTQAVLPNHDRRRSSMALPTFDATSSGASRDSNYTFFGEPGPSRPGTNLFTPGLPTGRTVRQSDPFDLDRPEVLGFGDVIGRKEVGGSVTRQASRNKRVSSVGNWGSATGGPYVQYTTKSAKPGPSSSPNERR